MKKRAILTVGLGFGDEGKGATVDFLTRRFEADLVVRYCGGSQAGHNVELPDGRRHTFSQFGAGTLAGARTWLGPAMIIDSVALHREAEHLASLGVATPGQLLTIHPRCLVTTPWLQLANRVRELSRGDARHGSCGQGIGEARAYWLKYGEDAVFAADLRNPGWLRHKLELQRQRILLDLQEPMERVPGDALQELGFWDADAESMAIDLSENTPPDAAIAETVPTFTTAIFEGAQGVLLDEYRGFPPHTTWSTVTLHHAWELVSRMGPDAVSVLGITRAYSTRHGEGPLPTFAPALTERLRDPGNPWNRWQGSLRCGWLDLPLLRYAVAAVGPLDGLVVNHIDQVRGNETQVCKSYTSGEFTPAPVPQLAWQERLAKQLREASPNLSLATVDTILGDLSAIAPVVLTGAGPTHADRDLKEIRFRDRRTQRT
jgi:adenylosuccinate synthase